MHDFNAAAEHMFGRRREDVAGRELAPLVIPPAFREAHRRGLSRAVDTGEAQMLGRPVELRALRASGDEFAAEVTLSRLVGQRPASFVGHIRDITSRLESERAVRRLAATVEGSPDAIYSFEPDGTVMAWNSGAERLFGYTADEMVGRSVVPLAAAGPDAPQVQAFFGRLRRGETFTEVSAITRKDGLRVEIAYTAFPIRDAGGKIVSGCVFARDVTEQHRLEERLRQAQKMEAIGQLAGGIAHDFNNLTTIITGYGELARAAIGTGPGADELKEIESAARRAAELTGQLLAFSRRQLLDPVSLDLGELARRLAPMLTRLIGDDIEVVIRSELGLPPVLADAGQIEQAVMNLAVNARDAMPDGGTLTIDARATVLEEDAGPAPYVCLSVSDTGVGIAADTLPRIFEPFFTTKAMGEGTGLGLASVHGAISQSGGEVRVQSEPGLGTTFEVLLPVARESRPARDAAETPVEDRRGGSETILLCEDEGAVRTLLERVLEQAGYEVLSASRPSEALALAEPERRIDGLISDVIMPDMPGPDLARQLQGTRPGLPTLFLSGYTADMVRGRGNLPDGSVFLEKPFDRVTLLRTLREMLDRAPT